MQTSLKVKLAHELEIMGTSSESASSSTVSGKPSGEVTLNGSSEPARVNKFLTPTFVEHDSLFAIYLALWKGQGDLFRGAAFEGVQYSTGAVTATDDQAAAKGFILVNCGEQDGVRGEFNPSDEDYEETGREADLSVSVRMARRLGIEKEPYLKRVLADAILSRVQAGLPDTMLPSIIEIHPDRAGNNAALVKWVWQAYDVIVGNEMIPLAVREDEHTLLDFFEGWVKARPAVHERIVSRLRTQMEASAMYWPDSTIELASIAHAFQSVGKTLQETMNWLCTAFDVMAEEQEGFMAERARLETITPAIVVAEKFGRMKKPVEGEGSAGGKPERELIQKNLTLIVVTSANRHTQKAARSLGNDIVIAVRKNGRFGIFMNKTTTRGFGLMLAAKMIRYLVMARKGEADKAHRDWKWTLGCEGEYEGVDGLYFDRTGKMILNGSETVNAPQLQVSVADLRDIVQRCVSSRRAMQWTKEMVGLYEGKGKRKHRQ